MEFVGLDYFILWASIPQVFRESLRELHQESDNGIIQFDFGTWWSTFLLLTSHGGGKRLLRLSIAALPSVKQGEGDFIFKTLNLRRRE